MSALSPAPRISVIIPMYNTARYFGEALASVAAQTRPIAQVIAVDDGSTDDSVAQAAQHPWVTLVRRPHEGITATLNAGVALADGEFLAFLDADDRWVPDKTERQLAAFADDPGLDLVFGMARRFCMQADGAERVIDTIPGMAKVGMLCRRAFFQRVGAYNSEGGHDFVDWMARAQEHGARSRVLPDVVYERRIHDTNYGLLSREQQRKTYFTAIQATLARRRAKARAGE